MDERFPGGPKEFMGRQRNDKFQAAGPRDLEQHRNIRYEDGFRGLPMNEPERPSRPGKPWHSWQKTLRGRNQRSPRIVKYIADKNGFAIREDLIKPLQETIDRTRQESRRRIVTASAAGLPQSSLSQVVTSAIRVAGQSNGNGGGKVFTPDIRSERRGKDRATSTLTNWPIL
ncbi:uncharacterized protein CEXT_16481 [Caerostris extrusa]|uniref:Uncharacterized protein n=1 Tax=Caerostris extrusa TaxID=172846 RepID=A0AAV4RSS3_CAEEX|nr:uncharacterized protein CEXT_16481 [Caerostris extrusa]